MENTIVHDTKRKCEGNPHRVKVLVYHRIIEDQNKNPVNIYSVRVSQFRRQLELLDRWGFTAITLNEYRLFKEGKLDLPAHPVVITFDDGYADTYTRAYPILQEFGMKAVVFVLGDRRVKTNYWDRHLGFQEVPLLDGQHIVELHRAGFEIGSHSMTHSRLTTMPENKAWEEISRSRILLEILLDEPVWSFSYPYGSINGTVKRMVDHAGYLIGCGINSGPPAFGKDALEIRRINILVNTDIMSFAARMLGPYEYYSWFRWMVGRVLSKEDKDHKEINRILKIKKRRDDKRKQRSDIPADISMQKLSSHERLSSKEAL
jgi:peptidoglycan/xylan/chitin deacetylase (PgdA/CDA1 family)